MVMKCASWFEGLRLELRMLGGGFKHVVSG